MTKFLVSAALVAALALAATAQATTAQACTSFVLTSGDGSPIYGRTNEFGIDVKSGVSLIPAGYTYIAKTGATSPMSWTAKHNVIAMNVFGDGDLVVDGMNESGMAGGLLWFPGLAEYAESRADSGDGEMAPGDFLYWALSNFKMVDEVKKAVETGDVSVIGVKLDALGFVPPVHWELHDKGGNSIVIEPVGGQLKVFDNSTTVMTNAPGFEWHLNNLRNYMNLSPVNKGSVEAFGKTINQTGQGSGWLGLPGDPTPPSRFIRAASFVASVEAGDTADDALHAVRHVLNNFDIPFGYIRSSPVLKVPVPGKDAASEYTQWSVMADMKNGVYYVRSYDAMSYNSISFDDFSDGSTEIMTYALPGRPVIVPLKDLQK